jgi:hypothetical protein
MPHKTGMSDLKDFLAKRRKDLLSTLGPLLDQRAQVDVKIHRLKKELSDIDQAAKAVGLEAQTPTIELIAERRSGPTVTIKEAVLEVLEEHSKGLTALDILSNVNRRFNLGIERTSLSPQLSRLKHEGKITNFGAVWRPQKREGPAK